MRSNARPADAQEYDGGIAISSYDRQLNLNQRDSLTSRNRSVSTSATDFEYIYVDADQFYLNADKLSGKEPKMKNAMKAMKTARLKADPYVGEELDNILVVDLPFRITREFNSVAMFRKDTGVSIVSATTDFLTKYPKYRKSLKTFALCLDFMLRRCQNNETDNSNNVNSKCSSHQNMLSILVYAQPDDRFDLLTLETRLDTKGAKHIEASGSRRKDKGGRR